MLLFFLTKIIDFSNDDGVMMNGDDDGDFLGMFRRELCVMLLPLAAAAGEHGGGGGSRNSIAAQ